MKFTLSWLKDFLETSASTDEISHQLSMMGLEVESVTNPADALGDFIIAHIKEAEAHPHADRLKVCKVDTGQEMLQVVCGAPNARAGLKVVFAPEGACIPVNGLKLKRTKIRDVESCGMMCSAAELKLGEDSNGIIELPEDAPIGQRYVDYAALDDPIFDISITPNRGDCLSIYGIARDLAAAGIGQLKHPSFPAIQPAAMDPICILTEEEATSYCPLFMGRIIRGVQNKESPLWMQQRLKAIGLRPKSALVDITNYLQFAFGRPMHAFDADKIQGSLHVRLSKEGEKLAALNDSTYELDREMLVVADDTKVLSLAGIIGGTNSSCQDDTVHVFLESAVFDPKIIATTGRKLQILTDSRYRFERGVDAALVGKCLDMATQFILEHCGGQASETIMSGSTPSKVPEIHFDPNHVLSLTGLSLSNERIKEILTHLGFQIDNKQTPWHVTPPTWRHDCTIAADLVEEIARIHGYDYIQPLLPVLPDQPNHYETYPGQNVYHTWGWAARRLLASRGYHEALTWSFLPENQAKAFGGGDPALKLMNPIHVELTDMRPSLLPNLLVAAQRNFDKGYPNTAFFEVGSQFHSAEMNGQSTVVSGIRTGLKRTKHWQASAIEVDVYQAKQDAQAILDICRVDISKVQTLPQAPSYYHPERSGTICLGPKNVLAYFGEIHPKIAKMLGLKERAVGFEVILNQIPLPRQTRTKPLNLSSLQPVQRDFAFILKEDVHAQSLVQAIQKVDRVLIQDVSIFDVYQGKGVEEGFKSIALSVTLQPQHETFTEAVLADISQKIIHSVEQSVGGRLRS